MTTAISQNRVTWLLPIKNGMPFLPETLASIAAQTYPNHKVLAWDNGSTDGTLEELRRWIPERIPGCIIVNRPMGLGASLREMVEEAETELCVRIDADDINLPERLQKQVAFLNNHPEVAVVGCQVEEIDGHGNRLGRAWTLPCTHVEIVHFLLWGWAFWHPSVMFRRSAVLEAGNYHAVGDVNVEDLDLWYRMAAQFKLANLEDTLLYYRRHEGSVTARDSKTEKLKPAADVRFCEYAPRLYGLTAQQALAFRKGKHPCALLLLVQVARHLERTQGRQWRQHITCPWLIEARRFIPNRDIITRLSLAMLDKRENALAQEIRSLGTTLYARLRHKNEHHS